MEDSYSGLTIKYTYSDWNSSPGIDIINSRFTRTRGGAVHVGPEIDSTHTASEDRFHLYPIIQVGRLSKLL